MTTTNVVIGAASGMGYPYVCLFVIPSRGDKIRTLTILSNRDLNG